VYPAEAKSEEFDDYLKKLVIINHIFDRNADMYIKNGQDKSIFKQLWNGKFESETNISERYHKANEQYRYELRKLYLMDIRRLEYIAPAGR